MKKKQALIVGGIVLAMAGAFFFPKPYVGSYPYTKNCGPTVMLKRRIGKSVMAPSSNECTLTDMCFGWTVSAE